MFEKVQKFLNIFKKKLPAATAAGNILTFQYVISVPELVLALMKDSAVDLQVELLGQSH